MKISPQQGRELLRIARQAISAEFSKSSFNLPVSMESVLSEKRGVFVTLKKNGALRGCIGFPEPIFPLGIALIRAARAAAFEDSRFLPLTQEELPKIKIEVTVLTPPKKLVVKEPKEYLKKIKIGRDGLIVRRGSNAGLLLPQVPLEFGWDVETFLAHTCLKAGLPPDAWQDPNTEVYTFQGKIFSE